MDLAPAGTPAGGEIGRGWTVSRAAGAVRWLRRQRLAFLIAAGILLLHVGVALTGPVWAPYPPDELLVGDPFKSPSREHLFGTDNFGRDVFSRVVYGERTVLSLSLTAAGLAVVAGSALGLLMAYVRGWLDEVVMRGVDVVLTIPPLILSLLILGGVGASYPVIIATVAFFFAARVATVIRAAALDVVSEDFVTAARLRGESAASIARRELLPNVTSSMLVEFSLRTGYSVLFIAGLSFLGFGSAPPTPDWGLMINEGRSYISSSPWLVLGPSLALASLVVALSLFTDGISDALGLSPFRRAKA
ncbi:MAG: ABC transporter permease [Actinobacteria bacterium]|nr:ABC transporter permease [Actinomycetota bacterium]